MSKDPTTPNIHLKLLALKSRTATEGRKQEIQGKVRNLF